MLITNNIYQTQRKNNRISWPFQWFSELTEYRIQRQEENKLSVYADDLILFLTNVPVFKGSNVGNKLIGVLYKLNMGCNYQFVWFLLEVTINKLTITITLVFSTIHLHTIFGLVIPPPPLYNLIFHFIFCSVSCLGMNYVLMGKVDQQGNGLLSPSSFTLLYKPIHAKALASLSRKSCWRHSSIQQSH